MPEHYNDIRSMIKSKKECRQTQHKASEQDRFEKLLAVNKAMLSPDMLQIDKLPADKFENFCKLLSEYGIQLNSPADLEDMPLEQQNLLTELANKFTQMDWQGYGLEDFAPHSEDKYLPETEGDGNDVARSHEGFSLDDNGEITGKIMLSAKEEKGSEDDSEGSKDKNEEKSEEKEPETDSEPPKSDPEEAQDDEPAPEMPENGDFGSEMDYSELGEVLAEIAEKLGEEVAQEILEIMAEHIDDEDLEDVIEAKEEAESTPEEAKMEPFDGGAAVLMGVEGADEPEDEYVSIRECINLRKSGNKHASYNKEMSAFKKAANPAGRQVINPAEDPYEAWQNHKPGAQQASPNPANPGTNDQAFDSAQKWTEKVQSTLDAREAQRKNQRIGRNLPPNPEAKPKQTNPAQTNTDVDPEKAGKEARDKEKQKILQEQSDAWEKRYGAEAEQQAAAKQPRAGAGGGNSYYSLFGPKLNGQPGLLSRLAQAIRKWRLNSARVNRAGQQATDAASSASAAGAQTRS